MKIPIGPFITPLTAILLLGGCGGGGGGGNTGSAAAPLPIADTTVTFADVSAAAGLSSSNGSFGAAWGDMDNDGYPDLWVSHHGYTPALYRNNRNGTLSDIASQVIDIAALSGDKHGPAWADYDGNGDQDLLVQVGADAGTGTGPNHVFAKSGGSYIDRAVDLGLDFPNGRGRTPLWLDLNLDGRLDVVLTNAISALSPGVIAACQDAQGKFAECYGNVFPAAQWSEFALLGDLNNDGALDLMAFPDRRAGSAFSLGVPAVLPFVVKDTAGNNLNIDRVSDAVIGDFDGDLKNDVLLVRDVDKDGYRQRTANQVETLVFSFNNEKTLSVQTAGSVTFEIYGLSAWWSNTDIRIGSGGYSPACTVLNYAPCRLVLASTDIVNQGIVPHAAGADIGIYIGFDVASTSWKMSVSSDAVYRSITAVLNSEQPVASVGTQNFVVTELDSYLLINKGSHFEARVFQDKNGIRPRWCDGVVAADFDNDMNLDLYFVCNDAIGNIGNKLFWNDGTGHFVAGNDPTVLVSSAGRADPPAVADLDLDGFMDIFIPNGSGIYPFSKGPHQLLRNSGNRNHWVEIDLVGTRSNRDGIGASIVVTAGGRQQLREANSGTHHRSQNFKRLHFGLGNNSLIDQIEVRWPSGVTSTVSNVAADRILTLVEP
jgi:hypothetical protein